MATFKSNTYSGRYLSLTITETVDVPGNKSTLKWTLTSTGGSSTYYSIAPTTIQINGTTVYSKGATAWSDKVFPAAKGSKSGTISVAHNSDGTKSVSVVFNTAVWYSSASSYGGTMTLTRIDRTAPTVSFTASNITASSVKITVTSSTTSNRWWYSLNGGSSWKEFNSTDGTKKEVTVTGLTPNTSYTIQTCARKKSNNVDGYSSKKTVKTLGGSVISSVSKLTADAESPIITFNCTVYNASYKHTLAIKNGSATILSFSNLTLVNGSNSITLNSDQRETILKTMESLKSLNATFELKTYSGSTQIGTASTKTVTIETTAAKSSPIFTSFIFQDINTKSLGVTENDQILIQGISTLKVTATAATPKNGASISSYSVVAGSAVRSSVSTEIQFSEGEILDTGTIPITVTAIDSRGYTSSVTTNVTVLPYEKIDISTYFMRRVNDVEVYSEVEISGSMSPVNVNEINKNAFDTMLYRFKKTSDDEYSEWADISSEVIATDMSFSFEKNEWLDLDADYSYYVEVSVSDKLSSDSVTLTIPQGIPLMSYRRKKIGINNRNPQSALDVNGNILMNGYNLFGFISSLGDTEDLNDITDIGLYTQALNANASTERNYPKAKAGFLEVFVNPEGYVLQRYTAYDNSGIYVRERYNNSWLGWKALTLSSNV